MGEAIPICEKLPLKPTIILGHIRTKADPTVVCVCDVLTGICKSLLNSGMFLFPGNSQPLFCPGLAQGGQILLRRQASKGLALLASKSEGIHAHVASKAFDFLHKEFYIIKSLTPSVMHASGSKLPAWEGDLHY